MSNPSPHQPESQVPGDAKPPRYQAVARQILRWIESHAEAGDRLPTEPKLAERFAVSVGTVRRAVGELEQAGYVRRVQGSGTFVESDPRHVAVVVALSAMRRGTFHSRLAGWAVQTLWQQGRRAALYVANDGQPGWPCDDLVDAVGRGEVKAVISVPVIHEAVWVKACDGRGVPLVQHNPQPGRPGTVMPWESWVDAAVDRLVSRGCHKLAMISWYDPAAFGHRPDRRYDAFARALQARGLKLEPAWVRRDLAPERPTAGWEEFREIWSASRSRPDGLIVCDDVLYRQAARAIVELGLRPPHDLQVVCQSSVGSGMLCPFPTERLAFDPAEVARLLVDQADAYAAGRLDVSPTVTPGFTWETDGATVIPIPHPVR